MFWPVGGSGRWPVQGSTYQCASIPNQGRFWTQTKDGTGYSKPIEVYLTTFSDITLECVAPQTHLWTRDSVVYLTCNISYTKAFMEVIQEGVNSGYK